MLVTTEKPIPSIFALLALLLLVTSATKAERWYEIEIILFEQATEERLASEQWDSETALPSLADSLDFISQPAHLKTINALCFSGISYAANKLTFREIIPEQETLEVPVTITNSSVAAESSSIEAEVDATIAEPEKPFQLLDKSEHELVDVYQQLRRRRGYRMLFHQAWRQPASREKDSQPIRIYAGMDYGEQFNYQGDAIVDFDHNMSDTGFIPQSNLNDLISSNTTTPTKRYDQTQEIHPMMDKDAYFKLTKADHARQDLTTCNEIDKQEVAKQHQSVWQIDGTVHIYTDRFRHVETNLVIRFPDKEEVDLRAIETNLAADEVLAKVDLTSISNNNYSPEKSSFDWQFDDNFLNSDVEQSTIIRDVLKYYPLQQSRRIIDSKIHYFDHPLFGMIIQMRNYDPDDEQS